ncbi:MULTISPECIES: cellobiose phosphorylase [unclassified Fusibacter]|uniref:cellobiose phosphorylase n=1 Tax=unclassified Fusibacter TaxID=2624464 RepID=UPI001010F911|nr:MULTISPECIES: cellobiose phosphorylase [unclassified Fusibacter]MCK8060354.1 cellobiose phosphorylase [Fusibacter sp. A2]NPE20357.1 cellobiose phosphorylase [Fusibacter sp. A1]RXV63563.1 cellobiose phosphorylase [Fusibacter sp. A1]
MSKYRYEEEQFIIESYDEQKPFASFLPGIAGLNGIPMWVYYANRGQGIAGFGVENKDGSIFDFVPANVAYKRTELQGFRTFVKVDGKVHEIFSSASDDVFERKMLIESNSVGFEEINHTIGIQVNVKYYTTTNTSYPGLIRKVTLKNLSDSSKNIEVLDGLMTVWPFQNSNFVTKNLSNLAVAWFEAYNTDVNMPFFRNRSTTNDSAEVGTVEAGHFYAAFVQGRKEALAVVYDPEVIFGEQTGLLRPVMLMKESLVDLLKVDQVSANKLPCAFGAFVGELDDILTISSIVGKTDSVEVLNALAVDFGVDYFNAQESQAAQVTKELTDDVQGKTAYKVFDAYVKQSYLDNLLRGGYPLTFEGKEGPIVYHVYSRIHGDMEREYNDFYVEPAYYSHGVGNFRDVNQNRRNDVYFVKEAGLYNIKQFMELLQIDGQNPLSVKGSKLSIDPCDIGLIEGSIAKGAESIRPLLMKPFTPGELLTKMEQFDIKLKVSREDFLKRVMSKAIQENQAAYGHGFWVDHWTYNMDLVDNYLNIYPDRLESLLYEDQYKYFRSPDRVLPRKDKYVLTKDGKVRQYDAIHRDSEKLETENFDISATNWTKDTSGQVLKTTLAEKLMILTINKMTNFDPSGLGIMMNSDKPGWNDAMNGLPGLFGSGMSEVIEIKRVINFLTDGLSRYPKGMVLPVEVAILIDDYHDLLKSRLDQKIDELKFWESVQDKKENYLEKIEAGIDGRSVEVASEQILSLLESMLVKIEDAIAKATKMGDGILPSYLVHDAVDYCLNEGAKHPVNGMQTVTVKRWCVRILPLYLEAPARYLKQLKDKEEAKVIFDKIRLSGMYDEKLKMYITSESLEEETLEIGRARAFTAGWLERESVFMHMSYKYLLGLIKSGLHEEFYVAACTALPPFMDPAVYGRSTLENSSFIASSRNPNPKNHGRGFVSRLTGTTSEMITMWLHMMTGTKLFSSADELTFSLNPVLRSDFFDESGEVSFTLLKETTVIYRNPKKKDTFGTECVSPVLYELELFDGDKVNVEKITGALAHKVRDNQVKTMIVTLG